MLLSRALPASSVEPSGNAPVPDSFPTPSQLRFPKGFLWGTATSSHQIEGNNTANDWWRTEQEGRVPYKSGAACDSYNRYEEDFDIAASFNNNAARFSLEWSRIEPREGEFSREATEHYRKMIRAAKERGLEPFVTILHFTLPQWVAEKGGWNSRKTINFFERYTRYVAEELGEEAQFWFTINEPNVVSLMGYSLGIFPPHQKSILGFVRSMYLQRAAHKRAYRAFKDLRPDAHVGVVYAMTYFVAYQDRMLSRIAKGLTDHFANKWFLNGSRKEQDFMAVNYYFGVLLHVRWSAPWKWHIKDTSRLRTDFDWEIWPEGIYHIVNIAKRYKKPIYITENGIADADDDQRPSFIRDHLEWLHKAIADGADVRGYFHWSLLDNFEWGEGYTKRFGLVEVDFDTFKRTPRRSYLEYKRICERNGL
ncbi:MAG: glycoside hydrolase family 1 protein [Candidatus Spechtbacterales bacterium]